MNVAAQDDPLDSLLFDYERRKQEDARRQVKRAVRLEEARKRGAEYLHLFAIDAVRDVAARLTEAGHRVMQQELLDGYPPKVRLHLWPKPGPLDPEEPLRSTLELVWGEPEPEALGVLRLNSEGSEVQGFAQPRWSGRHRSVVRPRKGLSGSRGRYPRRSLGEGAAPHLCARGSRRRLKHGQ